MWSIQHPSRVFSRLGLNTTSSFFAHLIMTKKKFDTFNTDDIETLRNIAKDQGNMY